MRAKKSKSDELSAVTTSWKSQAAVLSIATGTSAGKSLQKVQW